VLRFHHHAFNDRHRHVASAAIEALVSVEFAASANDISWFSSTAVSNSDLTRAWAITVSRGSCEGAARASCVASLTAFGTSPRPLRIGRFSARADRRRGFRDQLQ